MADLIPTQPFQSYNDFGALGRLKGEAAQSPHQAIKETATQFEAHFLQQLMKTMRATVEKSDLHNQDQVQLYEEMMDKEVALQMARHGGIGLAKVLETQLQKTADKTKPLHPDGNTSLPLIKSNPGLPLGEKPRPLDLPSQTIKAYELKSKMGDLP